MNRSKRSVDAKQLTTNHVIVDGNKSVVDKENVSSNMSNVAYLNDIILPWDRLNWSCAYDSVFTILSGVWNKKPSYWNKSFKSQSIYLQELIKGFQQNRVSKNTFCNV